MFENRILRRIFGTRESLIGGQYKEEVHNLFYSRSRIRKIK
jgi:hypothetical protein